MSLQRSASVAVLLFGLLFAGSALAQTDAQKAQCDGLGADPDLVIRGCTAIIASPQSSGASVSLALSNRAVAYEARGRNDLAMADLDEAIKRDRKNPHAWVNRGNIYLAQGEFNRALSDFNQAIAVHANNAPAFGHRADAYLIHGEVKQ